MSFWIRKKENKYKGHYFPLPIWFTVNVKYLFLLIYENEVSTAPTCLCKSATKFSKKKNLERKKSSFIAEGSPLNEIALAMVDLWKLVMIGVWVYKFERVGYNLYL